MYSGPVCKNLASSPCLLPCYDYQGKEFGTVRADADGASDESVSAEWELSRQSVSVVSVSDTSHYRRIVDENTVDSGIASTTIATDVNTTDVSVDAVEVPALGIAHMSVYADGEYS